MAKYCDLFWSFFKVGSFTIGGGYAMIPLMERELAVRHRWMGSEEFDDMVALCQSLPGVFAVNMAAVGGYRLRGVWGSVVAVAGCVLMPVAMVLVLAMCLRSLRGNPTVEHIFMGLRPAVVALIAAPVFRMARTARVGWANCWVPVVAAVAVWAVGVSPIVVVLAAVAGGIAWGVARQRKGGDGL